MAKMTKTAIEIHSRALTTPELGMLRMLNQKTSTWAFQMLHSPQSKREWMCALRIRGLATGSDDHWGITAAGKAVLAFLGVRGAK